MPYFTAVSAYPFSPNGITEMKAACMGGFCVLYTDLSTVHNFSCFPPSSPPNFTKSKRTLVQSAWNIFREYIKNKKCPLGRENSKIRFRRAFSEKHILQIIAKSLQRIAVSLQIVANSLQGFASSQQLVAVKMMRKADAG